VTSPVYDQLMQLRRMCRELERRLTVHDRACESRAELIRRLTSNPRMARARQKRLEDLLLQIDVAIRVLGEKE